MDYGILDPTLTTVICKFVAPTKIINNSPSFVSDSVSLKRHAVSQKAQRWEILTNLMPENSSRDFFVHNTIHGNTGIFKIRMPQPYGLAAEIPSNSFVATGTRGSMNITVSGFGTIPAGSFVTFAGHSKVYTLTSPAKSGASTVFPPLFESLSSATLNYKHEEVFMECSYDLDTSLGITYVDGILSDPGQIKLIERI